MDHFLWRGARRESCLRSWETGWLSRALLGLVFAAFSLLIALFSDDYIRLLSKAEDGVEAFLRPSTIAIGLQVTAIVAAIGYRAQTTSPTR